MVDLAVLGDVTWPLNKLNLRLQEEEQLVYE